MPRSVRRLLVVLAVAVAGLVPAPADAAYCSGSGVNVVVDYGTLGGLTKACGTGSSAAAVFGSAGITLTRDQQYSSVVCKVNGLPADANCAVMPPADHYWGLFWSDGKTGHWVYSTVNVDALKVPSGGFVAFAWQSSSSQRVPAATPSNPQSQPSPTPTTKATASPTKKPRSGTTSAPKAGAPAPASASASGTPSTSPSASPTGTATPSATASSGATPSTDVSPPASAGEATASTLAQTDDGGGGLPWWIPVAVVLGLVLGGGTAWWTRSRRTT
ncbi:MAG TPA: hypothetical protein VFE07_13345 [Marmoricola sp.]|jgi:hypothetical protein|nr:hypothetical protein [Marmoricola sp.]